MYSSSRSTGGPTDGHPTRFPKLPIRALNLAYHRVDPFRFDLNFFGSSGIPSTPRIADRSVRVPIV